MSVASSTHAPARPGKKMLWGSENFLLTKKNAYAPAGGCVTPRSFISTIVSETATPLPNHWSPIPLSITTKDTTPDTRCPPMTALGCEAGAPAMEKSRTATAPKGGQRHPPKGTRYSFAKCSATFAMMNGEE